MDNPKINRACVLWHRRCGKDVTLWNLIIKKTFEKKGIYYYFLPTYAQAKKIIWDGINNDGFKFIDYVPRELLGAKNGTELKMTMHTAKREGDKITGIDLNGSVIQLIGTDNIDAIRGTNPIGCVFSEYAFQNPQVWDVIKPILKVNGGWAIFNTTPNGENHAYDLWNMANDEDDWFCQKLTIEDTNVLNEQDMDEERREGMPEEMIKQEYYCSFSAGVVGSYYIDYFNKAKEENRITTVPYEQGVDVNTSWDLGVNDTNAIWFWQRVGKEIRLIDYYEDNGEGLQFYLDILKKKEYNYGTHFFPHDLAVREYTSGKSREDSLREFGITNYQIIPKLSIEDGINCVRRTLPY